MLMRSSLFSFFFFNDTATTEIYTLSLHDALPISRRVLRPGGGERGGRGLSGAAMAWRAHRSTGLRRAPRGDARVRYREACDATTPGRGHRGHHAAGDRAAAEVRSDVRRDDARDLQLAHPAGERRAPAAGRVARNGGGDATPTRPGARRRPDRSGPNPQGGPPRGLDRC